ncbi:MAG: C45 family autoproteolytic acyltransferase/hydrolase [Stackebrandtia sp.]
MPQLPVVHLSGSPNERGRQHGAALSDRIAANVALYSRRLRHDAGLSEADIAERVALYLDVFTTASPDYRATMEGIAEASGQSLADITMLNARFEILYSAWSNIGTTVDGECTGYGAPASTTADGRVWIGQNWDWFPDIKGALVTWRDDDVTALAFTEAGIAGAKIGLNSAGIGLCVNGLGCEDDDWKRGGLPFHLRTARILASSTLTEAIGVASLDAPSCSANFLIGSATDGVVDVESSPIGSRRITAEADRVLVHANHFTDADALGVVQRFRSQPVTTFRRAQRLEELLDHTRPLTSAHIETALRDHDGEELGLCRRPVERKPEHLRIHTAFSVLLDLAAGTLSYTDGPPCESDYSTVSLPDVV